MRAAGPPGPSWRPLCPPACAARPGFPALRTEVLAPLGWGLGLVTLCGPQWPLHQSPVCGVGRQGPSEAGHCRAGGRRLPGALRAAPLLPTPASPSPLPSRPLLCAQKALSSGLATSVHLAVLPVMAKTPRRAGRLVKAGGGHGEKADETGQAWAGGEGLRPQPPLWEPPPPRPTVAPCRLSTRTRPHHRLAKAGGAVRRTPPSPLPPSSTLNPAEPTVVPAGAQGPHPRAAVLT